MEIKTDDHESYAVIRLTRLYGEPRALFGSSVRHRNVIEIKLAPAYVTRSECGRDIIASKEKPYISFWMSEQQLIRAMMSIGSDGTPITIKSFNLFDLSRQFKEPQFIDSKRQIDEDFRAIMQDIRKDIDEIKSRIMSSIGSCLTKGKSTELDSQLTAMYSKIYDTLPFVKEQFTEQVQRTINECEEDILDLKRREKNGQG